MQTAKKAVDRRGKRRKSGLPKVRVSKQAFDKVLEKLIKTGPIKREAKTKN